MSKSLTIKVTAKLYDLIQTRATAARLSKHEMATMIFNLGMQSLRQELMAQEKLASMSSSSLETKTTPLPLTGESNEISN